MYDVANTHTSLQNQANLSSSSGFFVPVYSDKADTQPLFIFLHHRLSWLLMSNLLMYINEITVKHSAEYFWCQRANKAAFKDVVSSPSTSLLCTSHEVVTQSCLIKIFSPSKSIRFMRSIFILRNNNKHQNHLSDDELNTEKTNSFPRKISRHYKTTQTDESQKFTSIYKQLRVCASAWFTC